MACLAPITLVLTRHKFEFESPPASDAFAVRTVTAAVKLFTLTDRYFYLISFAKKKTLSCTGNTIHDRTVSRIPAKPIPV